MYKHALVTGGAGFIGSHLCRALLNESMQVTVLDDLSMGKSSNVPEGAGLIVGDVRSADDVQKALRGIDIVFHEAARVSVRSSIKQFYDDADVNVMGTLNLLHCCADVNIPKFVLASSMAVYADSPTAQSIPESHPVAPISPYGIGKLAAERYCQQFASDTGTDCIALRYFNTYGPGQAFTPYVGVITIFIRQLLEQKSPQVFGEGEQRRDFVHVDDIVSANVLAMHSTVHRGIFNVGTGIATSVNEIATLLRDRIAPSVEINHVDAHSGELKNSIADVSRISDTLGYCPQHTLGDRIDEVIAYYRDLDSESSLSAD